jgi:C1A family cysteine protease
MEVAMDNYENLLSMGWLPDLPDFRDYDISHDKLTPQLERAGQKDSVKAMVMKMGVAKAEESTLAGSVDLRPWCSPIENQSSLGSCTANAGVGMMECCERRAFGRHIDASRLFLYKATRNLLHWTGDTGAYLRTTMEAMALFGVPPEEYWPYNIARYDNEPSAFCYSFAQNYQALQYVRLDSAGLSEEALLKRIKVFLAAHLPAMFGFTVFSSINQAGQTGKILFPCRGERVLGGHAVVAVGYDDAMTIENSLCELKTKGALLIRNSWGTNWGEHGYGYLPYEYVLKGLAIDWWVLMKNEWINTGKFKV